jgi:hypothetical protein
MKDCVVCGNKCRLIHEGNPMCKKHHPESIKKVNAITLKYYHTAKGKAAYKRCRENRLAREKEEKEIITT